MKDSGRKPESAGDDLRHAWIRTAAEYGFPAEASEDMYQELESAYRSPGRHYHNLKHLRRMMEERDRLLRHLRRPSEVSLALYYHDVIYVPGESDNEERSALLAEKRLREANLHPDAVRRISFMIRATAGHRGTGDGDADLFLDMDRAVLAAGPRDYRLYAEAIRREYGSLTDLEYRTGRRRFLEQLAGRPNIFLTEEYRGEPEIRARGNILEELKGLVGQ